MEYNFGELRPASISGYVYVDDNDNGFFDPSETGIGGVTLVLLDANGLATGKTTVTDATGYYEFTNLRPGTYGVGEVQPAGYYDGLDAAGTVGGTAHNPGDPIDQVTLAPGAAGVELQLRRTAAGEHQRPRLRRYEQERHARRRRTADRRRDRLSARRDRHVDRHDADRRQRPVRFTNLKPGVYGVEEVQPAGYLDSKDHVGSAGGAIGRQRPHRPAPCSIRASPA